MTDINKVADAYNKDRLSVLLQLTHEHCCVDPIQVQFRSVDFLNHKIQPINRYGLVVDSQEWQPLPIDINWMPVDKAGSFYIEHAEDSKGILVIEPQFIVRPGRMQHLEPLHIDKVRIRCFTDEPCTYRLIVFSN